MALACVPRQGLIKIVVLFRMIEEIVPLVLKKNGLLSKLLISRHPSQRYLSWNNFDFPTTTTNDYKRGDSGVVKCVTMLTCLHYGWFCRVRLWYGFIDFGLRQVQVLVVMTRPNPFVTYLYNYY